MKQNLKQFDYKINMVKHNGSIELEVECPTSTSTFVKKRFDTDSEAGLFIDDCRKAYEKSIIFEDTKPDSHE